MSIDELKIINKQLKEEELKKESDRRVMEQRKEEEKYNRDIKRKAELSKRRKS